MHAMHTMHTMHTMQTMQTMNIDIGRNHTKLRHWKLRNSSLFPLWSLKHNLRLSHRPREQIASKSLRPTKGCPKVRRSACKLPEARLSGKNLPYFHTSTVNHSFHFSPLFKLFMFIHVYSMFALSLLVHVLPDHKLRVFKECGRLASIKSTNGQTKPAKVSKD